MIEIKMLNCFLLIVPIFIWNAVFTGKLPSRYIKGSTVQIWPKYLEHFLRLVVFFYPLLLPLRIRDGYEMAGFLIYFTGVFIYFASWIFQVYFPVSQWSMSRVGFLAPAATPMIWLAGIALIGHSFSYLLLAITFIVVHIYINDKKK